LVIGAENKNETNQIETEIKLENNSTNLNSNLMTSSSTTQSTTRALSDSGSDPDPNSIISNMTQTQSTTIQNDTEPNMNHTDPPTITHAKTGKVTGN